MEKLIDILHSWYYVQIRHYTNIDDGMNRYWIRAQKPIASDKDFILSPYYSSIEEAVDYISGKIDKKWPLLT